MSGLMNVASARAFRALHASIHAIGSTNLKRDVSRICDRPALDLGTAKILTFSKIHVVRSMAYIE